MNLKRVKKRVSLSLSLSDKLKAINPNRIKKKGAEMKTKGACRACRPENQQEQALPVSRKNGGEMKQIEAWAVLHRACRACRAENGAQTSIAYAIGEQVLYQRLSQSAPDTQRATHTLCLSRLILAVI
jgi:hypothetical protein